MIKSHSEPASPSGTGEKKTAMVGTLRAGILRLTPASIQCRLYCQGTRCRYCRGSEWPREQQAITGLYSNWITDQILAMARPTAEAMETYKLVEQFKQNGIRSVLNLQQLFEHDDCGPHPLLANGFSYDPDEWMRNEIFYYNYAWPDFGCSSLQSLLDVVKVVCFALEQGKVAIHCHAGLGRTGVLIACYLVWAHNLNSYDAIGAVRQKRSVQSKKQIELVENFHQFVQPLRSVFRHRASFTAFLIDQTATMHGFEARKFIHMPKLVFLICERLLALNGHWSTDTIELCNAKCSPELFYARSRYCPFYQLVLNRCHLTAAGADNSTRWTRLKSLDQIDRSAPEVIQLAAWHCLLLYLAQCFALLGNDNLRGTSSTLCRWLTHGDDNLLICTIESLLKEFQH